MDVDDYMASIAPPAMPPGGAPSFGVDPAYLQQLGIVDPSQGAPPTSAQPAPMPDSSWDPSVVQAVGGIVPGASSPNVPPGALSPAATGVDPALMQHMGWTAPLVAPPAAAPAAPSPASGNPVGSAQEIIDRLGGEMLGGARGIAQAPGAALGAAEQGAQQDRAQRQADAARMSPLGQSLDVYKQLGDITRQQGNLDAAQATDNAKTLEDRNRRVADEQAAIAATEQALAAHEAELTKKYDDSIAAEQASTVDPNRKWARLGTGGKIAASIAIALSGLGDAIAGNKGPNAALQIIQNSIKEDVDQQYKEREDKQWQVGAARNSLDTYRQVAGDAIQGKQLKLAEEYRTAADQMEQTAQRYNSPRAKLNAQQGAQQLRMQAQQLISNTAAQQSTADAARAKAVLDQMNKDREDVRKQQEIANTSWGHALTKRGQDLQHDEKMAEQAGKETPAEKNWRELGVSDPITGDPLVTTEGRQYLDKARELDQYANSVSDPKIAAQTKQHAEQLRKVAAEQYGVEIPTSEHAEVTKQIVAVQGLADLRAKIKAQIAADPDHTDRGAWAQIGTEAAKVRSSYIQALGENPNARTVELAEQAMPVDIATWTSRTFNKGPYLTSLDTAVDDAVGDINARIKASPKGGDWRPRELQITPTVKTDAQTLGAQAVSQHPGDDDGTGYARHAAAIGAASIPGVGGFIAHRIESKSSADEQANAAALQNLAIQASSDPDPTKKAQALAQLAAVAANGPSQGLRDYAHTLLISTSRPPMPGESTTLSDTQTSNLPPNPPRR